MSLITRIKSLFTKQLEYEDSYNDIGEGQLQKFIGDRWHNIDAVDGDGEYRKVKEDNGVYTIGLVYRVEGTDAVQV